MTLLVLMSLCPQVRNKNGKELSSEKGNSQFVNTYNQHCLYNLHYFGSAQEFRKHATQHSKFFCVTICADPAEVYMLVSKYRN